MAHRLPHPVRPAPAGLTLIELTVALVIVGVLFSMAVVGVGALVGSRAKAAVGELGGVIRSLYDTAGLTGRTCRLVMELGPTEPSETLEYRAECAKKGVTRGLGEETPTDREKSGHAEASALPFPAATDAPSLDDLNKRERGRVEGAAKYAAFSTPEIQPRKLSGVRVSVWTSAAPKAVTHGTAYLYFFPQGYTERAQVVIEQGNNAWTLKVEPLTGKTSVVAQALEPPR